MHITAVTKICIGTGNCVNQAPEYFTQDDDTGIVVLLADDVAPGDEENVAEAASLCPVQAILLRDKDAQRGGRRR